MNMPVLGLYAPLPAARPSASAHRILQLTSCLRDEIAAYALQAPTLDDAIERLIDLRDRLAGDPDIEDDPVHGEHDGAEPDEDLEWSLGTYQDLEDESHE